MFQLQHQKVILFYSPPSFLARWIFDYLYKWSISKRREGEKAGAGKKEKNCFSFAGEKLIPVVK